MTAAGEEEEEYERLLGYLKESRGFDFTGYKRASLYRRIAKRMQELGTSSVHDYGAHLSSAPDEVGRLLTTILINVTGFFRDPPAWEVLRTAVVPALLAAKPDEPLRVWSAGCASGEEAYSLAMLFAEAVGLDQFRERVRVFATDLDEDALSQARRAVYGAREIDGVPPELREVYFERTGNRYAFRKDLRRCVVFGRNDLVRDAPLSRIDLLACRNTLMYFTAEAQSRVLASLHFALNEGGYLLLGRAETLFAHGNRFGAVDMRRRIFRKLARPSSRHGLVGVADLIDPRIAGEG